MKDAVEKNIYMKGLLSHSETTTKLPVVRLAGGGDAGKHLIIESHVNGIPGRRPPVFGMELNQCEPKVDMT